MLALLFYLGDVMHTIACERVREIVPMMTLRAVSHAPDFFAGFFSYRGGIVPVIDLRRLVQGKPCHMRLSTRIILADYAGAGHPNFLLGLMAERVTETIRIPAHEVVPPPLTLADTPYLGGIVMVSGEMIQHLELDRLPDCIGCLPAAEKGCGHASCDH
ncbi:chemotaxis protein CheW [Desulfonema ishimotonii]|uniref:Chemotaxis protein CheW n=1 Tax=Desulfonema ishimotonii TaxID=45657 RepID=A0A401G2Q4_9BACT|nr:chemotaxis protein CheW [Desulfonema ishimotonii]GBC63405.1 chemotaxis protein CheW [Desulfonema ishimotonii]